MSITRETAAHIMDANFIVVDLHAGHQSVAEKIRRAMKKNEVVPSILAVDRKKKLVGVVDIADILHASTSTAIGSLVHPIPQLPEHLPRADVLHAAAEARRDRMVVLDEKGRPIGIVHAKDLLHRFAQERSASLAAFANVHEEHATDSVWRAISMRHRWLVLNLATAFLATFTVSLFESTLKEMVMLAAFMPIVAGMGGNAGTQSIAVAVRGIALREITRKNAARFVWKELFAGLLNGIIVALVAAGFSLFVGVDKTFAIILAVALIINHINAGFFGAIIPLVVRRLGYDPALSSSIFVTTATDVVGFLVFLGLAQTVLL